VKVGQSVNEEYLNLGNKYKPMKTKIHCPSCLNSNGYQSSCCGAKIDQDYKVCHQCLNNSTLEPCEVCQNDGFIATRRGYQYEDAFPVVQGVINAAGITAMISALLFILFMIAKHL